jgi:hypothetical protein
VIGFSLADRRYSPARFATVVNVIWTPAARDDRRPWTLRA